MPEKSKPSNDINSKRLQFFQKQHQPPQTTSNSNSKRVNEIQPKSLVFKFNLSRIDLIKNIY